MAIEKDAGPGGEQPLVNGQVPPEVLIEELPQDPGIFEFDDGSAIGDDESANTNDWTANNLAATDVVPDSPENNFATSLILGLLVTMVTARSHPIAI